MNSYLNLINSNKFVEYYNLLKYLDNSFTSNNEFFLKEALDNGVDIKDKNDMALFTKRYIGETLANSLKERYSLYGDVINFNKRDELIYISGKGRKNRVEILEGIREADLLKHIDNNVKKIEPIFRNTNSKSFSIERI